MASPQSSQTLAEANEPKVSQERPSAPPNNTSYPDDRLKNYDSRNQTLRLLLKGAIRWIITAAIVGAIAGLLFGYQKRTTPVSPRGRRLFNSIFTVLSLCLAFNLQTSYKTIATDLRWRFLAKSSHSLREVDLILQCDSLMKVGRLAWVARGRPLVRLVCIVWIIINVGVQAAVGLISLTHSFEVSTEALSKPGQVNITDLTHYSIGFGQNFFLSLGETISSLRTPTPETEALTAYSYGYTSLTYPHFPGSEYVYPETARFQPVSLQNIFDFSDHWVHPFYEVAREIETVASHLQTNRTVNSTWECRDYNVIGSGDGLSTNITYNDEGREVSFDVRITAPNATTYITDTNITCGARCARVWAFQTMYVDNSTAQLSGARLYDCNITVSEVDNAYMAEHQLGDEQARIAAGAIARSPNSNDGTSLQWNLYPGNSDWADLSGPADAVGWLIARFAIGVVTLADDLNPKIALDKPTPAQGLALDIRRGRLIGLLSGIVVMQLIAFVTASLLASSVVVHDDSDLATARLLRPLVTRLGDGGTTYTAKEIDRTIPTKVIYGAVPTGSDSRRLALDEETSPLRFGRSFPSGTYD